MIAILGPTAGGKSATALRLAERLGGSVLSVDSMQVYRGMDIGTAKPSPAERARVPHHMIDLVDPEIDYTVSEFQAEARSHLAGAAYPIVISGGSGLHFRAVVDPLEFPPTDAGLRRELEAADPAELRAEILAADPHSPQNLDLANPRRVIRSVEILRLTGLTPSARVATEEAKAIAEYRPLFEFAGFGLDPGTQLGSRVEGRLEMMREAGLLAEVERLAPRMGRTAAQAVGYKELLGVVAGLENPADGFAKAEKATLALARNQRTYFRRDPRITWLPWQDDPEWLCDMIVSNLENQCGL